jgi:hypothetical protein
MSTPKLPPIDFKAAWDDAKANIALLDACPGAHQFVRLDQKPMGGRSRCTVCGGQADNLHAGWYEHGLEHGRRQAGEWNAMSVRGAHLSTRCGACSSGAVDRRTLYGGDGPDEVAEFWRCADCHATAWLYCDGTISDWLEKPVGK